MKTLLDARKGIEMVKATSLTEVAGNDYVLLAFLLMIDGADAIASVAKKYPPGTEKAMAAVYASALLKDVDCLEHFKDYFYKAIARMLSIINCSKDDAKKLRIMPLLPKLLVRADEYALRQSVINGLNEAMDSLMLAYGFYIYDFGFTYSALCIEGDEKYVC